MNIKRYLKGKIIFHYEPWSRWKRIGIDKYWSGRIIYFQLGKFAIELDCRLNWLEDMITGRPK